MLQCQHLCLLLVVLLPAISCDGSKQPEPARAEVLTQEIVLTDAGDQKILAIKTVREVTGLGLRDAKDIVDSAPSVIISGLTVEETEIIASKLRGAGMTIEVRKE